MAKHMFVRPALATDGEKFTRWSIDTKNNLVDPEVVGYKTTYVRCVFDKNGPVLFAPIQKPLMVESLAFKPESESLDRAVAMKELIQDTVSQAFLQGAGEIFFLCSDPSTAEYAARQEGIEELTHRVFRIKLSNLENNEKQTKTS